MVVDRRQRTAGRHRVRLLAATLLSGTVLPQGPPPIPPLRAESFSGQTVALPDSLHNRPGVLVLGFSQSSRDAVTLWGTRLAHQPLAAEPTTYYEIPVLAAVPRVLRSLVLGRIRADVAEAARPHFIPLLDHETEWRTLVHYNAPDDAYILLVDGHGTVRWQTQGPPTDATYAALAQQVRALQPMRPPASAK